MFIFCFLAGRNIANEGLVFLVVPHFPTVLSPFILINETALVWYICWFTMGYCAGELPCLHPIHPLPMFYIEVNNANE